MFPNERKRAGGGWGTFSKMQGKLGPPTREKPARTLGALGVAVLCFSAVAGGPFGIEPAVQNAGALPTLLSLVLVTLAWACTQALMVAELSTMMPSNAGYIVWVFRGLGPAAGFTNAWLCTLQQVLNIPLYAVLACNSLEQLVGALSPGAEYGVKFAVVAAAAAVNVAGVELVERVSGAMVLLVQTPFVLMPIAWAVRGRPFQWTALGASVRGWDADFAVFLSTVCWNVQGWNVVGNVAGEVARPSVNIPAGVGLACLLVALNYLWPLAFTIPMSPPAAEYDPASSQWGAGFFVSIAQSAFAPLGVWAALCAVLSCMSNFIPQLATSSRALQATAAAGMLPGARFSAAIAASHPRFRTPVAAICAICGAVLCLVVLDFNTLVTTQILLALAGLCLQFAAFLALKHREPGARRPYAVPGGVAGAWALSLPFFALAALICFSNVASVQGYASLGAVAGATLLLWAAGAWWARRVDPQEVLRALLPDGEGAGGGRGAPGGGAPSEGEGEQELLLAGGGSEGAEF